MTQDPFSKEAAEQFLSGGAPTQKFPREGFKWGGTVESWEMAQQTDMDTGELLFWNDGKPRMQLVMNMQGEATGITWETNLYKEVALPDDDGSRRLYVKGNLQKAVAKAIKDSGGQLESGAYCEVTRGKDLPPKKRGQSGAYTYTAVWTPASKNPHAAAAMLNQSDDDESPFGS